MASNRVQWVLPLYGSLCMWTIPCCHSLGGKWAYKQIAQRMITTSSSTYVVYHHHFWDKDPSEPKPRTALCSPNHPETSTWLGMSSPKLALWPAIANHKTEQPCLCHHHPPHSPGLKSAITHCPDALYQRHQGKWHMLPCVPYFVLLCVSVDLQIEI